MKWVKKTSLAILSVFIALQFIQPGRNKSGQILPTDITTIYSVPENVTIILKNACYDCHSNNTLYPWYTNVQPVGWLLAYHIKRGKAELNFSNFGSYTARKQMSKLRAIENSLKDGTMPLSSYTLIHKNARLSKEDKTTIIDWIARLKIN
jgi:hypothetical protein